MEAADVLLIALALAGIAGVLWLFNRLLKYFERRGWIRPREQGSGGHVLGSLSALDEAINPAVKHVHRVHEHRKNKKENDGEGDEPPESRKTDRSKSH
jgi:hypothetical protein